MRVVKTRSKQLQLAASGQLHMIVGCGYVRASPDDVNRLETKFYARRGN